MPAPPTRTFAPRKFRPRINTRTGLIEWPVHQPGGSTFSTSGVCAAPDETPLNTRATKKIDRNEKRCACFIMGPDPALCFHFGLADSPVSVGHFSQPLAVIPGQSILLKSPGPIARGAVGQVHACFSSEPQQILQWYNCRVGN